MRKGYLRLGTRVVGVIETGVRKGSTPAGILESISGGGGGLTVSPTGITSEEVFGTAELTTGVVVVGVTGIASGEVFGTAGVTAGAIILGVTSISTAEVFGTPELGGIVYVSPDSITSTEALGTPELSTSVTVSPTGVLPREAFGIPDVRRLLEIINPTGITSGLVFGNHLIKNGDGIAIPLSERETFEKVAVYLHQQGFDGQVNDVILDWLLTEGYEDQFNQAFMRYLEGEGYTLSFSDKYTDWKKGL